MPPLRDRRNDLLLLLDHFIMHFNAFCRKNIERLSADTMGILLSYSFPGNIRELENILHHAFILCQGSIIEKKHLPEYLLALRQASPTIPKSNSFEAIERQKIVQTLERNRYNRKRTAKELGMHVATLWRKIKRYGIK